jgi:hypothetical protein
MVVVASVYSNEIDAFLLASFVFVTLASFRFKTSVNFASVPIRCLFGAAFYFVSFL